ncbi:RNA polymerase sigma factor [Dactylosporangium cerinum]|uniref:RNA polymerase sigma factor n=1 Tax=Dactylosporangium cerinum TaxID=1434730 RepID=A0ABV9WFP4_9ACTN
MALRHTTSQTPADGGAAPAAAETAARHRQPVAEADLVLAARVRVGDRDAFADLYRHTVQRVTAFVTARVHRSELDLVDDLVHDAYCLALTKPHRVGPDLVGSMYALAARALTSHSWSQRRYLRAAHTVYTVRTADAAPGPADRRAITAVAHSGVSNGALSAALARLTADQRHAVQLRYLDGYSRGDAAVRMRRTVAAIESLERRALLRLHELSTAAGTA